MTNEVIKVPAIGMPEAPPGRMVRSRFAKELLSHLMVLGPGLIVMEADNDAGAVSTYTQAGAQYGNHLLWLILLLLPVCYFIQEMVVRLGIATGEGHAAMIYKRFGRWWGHFSLFDLLLVNFLTLVTEFAAIALATAKLGVSPFLAVPLSALALVVMVATGSYLRWERVTIFLCLLDLGWLALAHASGTSGGEVLRGLLPSTAPGGFTPDLILLMVAIVGTTIAPWQLFFQQSCIADKRLRFADLKYARFDTFFGACFTVLIAGAMVVVGAAAYRHGLPFTDPAQMATALGPLLGKGVQFGLLLFMINAAVLGTTAVSLSSAWAVGEVWGWPHSLQRKFSEARGFYLIYALCVFAAAAIVLIPRAPLQVIIIGVQVLAGLVLPAAIVFLQLLLNDRELLGDDFVNKRWQNIVNWTIVLALFALSLVLAVQVLAPQWFGQ